MLVPGDPDFDVNVACRTRNAELLERARQVYDSTVAKSKGTCLILVYMMPCAIVFARLCQALPLQHRCLRSPRAQ